MHSLGEDRARIPGPAWVRIQEVIFSLLIPTRFPRSRAWMKEDLA